MQTRNIIICLCNSRPIINKEKAAHIAALLRENGENVQLCPDLCRTMQNTDAAKELAGKTILACYPRAIRSHFATHGIESGQIIDIRNNTQEEIVKQLRVTQTDKPDTTKINKQIASLPTEPGTDAWYPIIDKEQCAECEKCHDFCLFGVYTIEEGRVKVTNPQNCKNNCPACARICPAKAIIFPKYEKSPINGGTDDEEQALSIDSKAIYNEALRMRLQHRRNGISLLRNDNK